MRPGASLQNLYNFYAILRPLSFPSSDNLSARSGRAGSDGALVLFGLRRRRRALTMWGHFILFSGRTWQEQPRQTSTRH